MEFALFFEGESRSVRFVYVRTRAEKNDAKAAKLTGPTHPTTLRGGIH